MMKKSMGRYEIQSEIGRGGMASVYLAYDPRFRRQVAVKVLSSQFLAHPILRARFEREARLIATIEHPAIVPVYDFGEQDDELYLVMRYMPGGPLSSKLRQGPLSFITTLQILSQLAPALDVVHARRVVHRDLKPGNILFDGFDNPALSDFGIAYLTEATVQLTGDGVIGTPAYMSPEQVQGEVELDGRSDIYALGVILYEMLSGRQPFRSTTPMSTALKHLREPAPKISINRPDLPSELDLILAKALAKDREARYQKASELIFDLRSLPETPSSRTSAGPDGLKASASEAQTMPDDQLPHRQTASASEAQIMPDDQSPDRLTEQAELLSAPLLKENASIAKSQIEAISPELLSDAASVVVKQPVAASETDSTPSRSSLPLPDLEQPGKTAKRQGWMALGAGWITFIGICSLVLLIGLFYRIVLQPDVTLPPTASLAVSAPSETPPIISGLTDPSITPSLPVTSALEPHSPDTAESLLFDDFSQPAYGWPVVADEASSYSYQDGVYRFAIQLNDTLFWATPDRRFADASISVSTTLVSGSQESYYGLICRLQDNQEFYYFVIRVDGRFTIGRYANGEFLSLLPGGWVLDPAIRTGNAQNQLQADCVGDQLRFFVNSNLLAEVQEDSLANGNPGLAAAAIGVGELEVHYDNFLVTRP